VVFTGPSADPDPRLRQLANVHFTGPIAFDRLVHLAAAATVLIMPYGDMPATRAMQPLKLKEYLATGKPVVVRDLPATREWADALDLATTAQQWIDAVCLRASQGVPEAQMQARKRLQAESWASKARQFQQWILAHQRGVAS
jgi:glycosyltransferase involved in cell wall biosynthesis